MRCSVNCFLNSAPSSSSTPQNISLQAQCRFCQAHRPALQKPLPQPGVSPKGNGESGQETRESVQEVEAGKLQKAGNCLFFLKKKGYHGASPYRITW